ncbi:hypothetical protein NIES4101_35740 [Calothrix sp. NIES-4101]|nr:hypothetical protein NIES4101_35740 [Calothrix sp. NIES-4101]
MSEQNINASGVLIVLSQYFIHLIQPNINKYQGVDKMKSLKLAAVIAIVGTMLFIPKTFAGSLSDSNAVLVT